MNTQNTIFFLKLYIFVFLIVGINIYATASPKESVRSKYNFNGQWLVNVGETAGANEVSYNDSSWKKITLPRAFNEDEAFKIPIDSLSDGIIWYRKHFKLPKEAKGKKVFIEFEGIRFGGEFYINGKSVGIHENGVMAFGFDITDHINFNSKNNVIAIRIDNSWNYEERATGTTYQWNNKNFNANYGGIPKNVYLHVTDRLYQTLPLYSNLKTTGTYIYAREINITKRNAIIHAESEVRNEYNTAKSFRFDVEIEDMDGKIVKKIQGNTTSIDAGETKTVKTKDRLDDMHFWSWGYGYL